MPGGQPSPSTLESPGVEAVGRERSSCSGTPHNHSLISTDGRDSRWRYDSTEDMLMGIEGDTRAQDARVRRRSWHLGRAGLLKCIFGLVVLFFWAALIQSRWAELSAMEWSVDWRRALIALAVFCLYFLGQGVGWAALARAISNGFPFGRGLGVWLISMPARYVPGNVWHIVARIDLARRSKVPPEAVLVSSALADMLLVLSAACLGSLWLPFWAGSSWVSVSIVFCLLCLAGVQPPVLSFFLRLASKLLHRPMPLFNLGYRPLAALFMWYIVVNVLSGAAFVLLVESTGQPVGDLWPVLASAYCLAFAIGYVSFLTPSGIGVREAALTAMMGLYMPLSTAVVLSLLARLFSVGGEALAVIILGIPLAGRRSQSKDSGI